MRNFHHEKLSEQFILEETSEVTPGTIVAVNGVLLGIEGARGGRRSREQPE